MWKRVGKGIISGNLEKYLVQWGRGSGEGQSTGEGQAQRWGYTPAAGLLQDVGSKEGRCKALQAEGVLAGRD